MPMSPGQYVRDILFEASSPRVLVWHTPKLARVRTRGYSPLNECVLTSALPGQEVAAGQSESSNRRRNATAFLILGSVLGFITTCRSGCTAKCEPNCAR